jgi:hypothetical protein
VSHQAVHDAVEAARQGVRRFRDTCSWAAAVVAGREGRDHAAALKLRAQRSCAKLRRTIGILELAEAQHLRGQLTEASVVAPARELAAHANRPGPPGLPRRHRPEG